MNNLEEQGKIIKKDGLYFIEVSNDTITEVNLSEVTVRSDTFKINKYRYNSLKKDNLVDYFDNNHATEIQKTSYQATLPLKFSESTINYEFKIRLDNMTTAEEISAGETPSGIQNKMISHLGLSGENNYFIEFQSFKPSQSDPLNVEIGDSLSVYRLNQDGMSRVYNSIYVTKKSDSTVTYNIEKFLVKNNSTGNFVSNSSLSGEDDLSALYVYPGYCLNNINCDPNANYLSIEMIDPGTNEGIKFSTNKLLIAGEDENKPLAIYYDQTCYNPILIDTSKIIRGGYGLFAVSGGKKSYNYNEDRTYGTIVNGVYVSYNYNMIYKYKYELTKTYANAYANDWFNINFYIDYNNLLLKYANYYSISVNTYNRETNMLTELATPYFTANGIIDDVGHLTYANVRQYLYKDSSCELKFIDSVPSDMSSSRSLKIGSLFTSEGVANNEFTNDAQNFSYKMFSFNFKIPKDGWEILGNEMYAPNPYFGSDILKNNEKNLIISDINTTSLKNAETSNVIFNGEFSFIYLVLDNRVVEQIVGNGNHGNGGYVDDNGVYHSQTVSSTKTEYSGVADKKLDLAYNAAQIKFPFTAKLIKGGTKLDVASPNSTISFSTDFYEDDDISSTDGIIYRRKTVTLNGIFAQTTINGISHNIIIPSLKLHVFLGWKLSGGKRTDFKIAITPLNDYYLDKNLSNLSLTNRSDCVGLINHNCTSLRHKDELICCEKIRAAFRNTYANSVFYKEWDYSNNFYHKWQNMAVALNHDENYFYYTWIPLWSINFGQVTNYSPVVNGKLTMEKVNEYFKISTASSRQEFNTHDSDYSNGISFITTNSLSKDDVKTRDIFQYVWGIVNPFSEFSGNLSKGFGYILSRSASDNPEIQDAEPMVMPRDISTNLFYYRGIEDGDRQDQDNAHIGDNDEAIIINARKMYSSPDQTDECPPSSTIYLDFEDLVDKEVVLTSKIIGNEDALGRVFKEVHVFVNNNLEYSREVGLDQESEGWRECRYTDAHSEGLQWKLFELADEVTFSTTDDFEVPVKQGIGNVSNKTSFKIPCKMSVSLSGLIFQQQCRYGIEFDNINNILFDQRVFKGDVFGISSNNDEINNVLKERFGLIRVGSFDQDGTAIPSALVNGVVNRRYKLLFN